MESNAYRTASEVKDATEFDMTADNIGEELARLESLVGRAEGIRDRQVGPRPSVVAGQGESSTLPAAPSQAPCYQSRFASLANRLDYFNDRLDEVLEDLGRF
jgi:hypothetical protein